MKKNILAIALTLTFASSIFADGDTPIMGYAGCEGGLWYPESQVCCMPNLECPVGRSAPAVSENTKTKILVEMILMLKNMSF